MEKTKTTSKQATDVKPMPELELPTLQDLLAAGSHFGHRSSTWNPKMKSYIYGERNGVHILDLIKTLSNLKVALATIQKKASEGNVLIVGTKGQAATMVSQMALQKGAFYVNKRWPGGLFTNFKVVKKSIDKLVKMEQTLASGASDMVKREELLMKREVARLNLLYEGIKFMDRLPTLVIVIDSKVEKNAIRESRNAGIPTVALVDTNCDPTVVNFPVPANDDSLKSIALFIALFGKALEGSKYAANLSSVRAAHATSLENARNQFEAEQERIKAMEEDERARLKALRQGKIDEAGQKEKTVLRVISKKEGTLLETTSLSARVCKSLNEAGIKTVEELAKLSKADILAVKGIGEKAAEDILALVK